MTIANGVLFDAEIENNASHLVFPRTMQRIDKMAYESLNLLTSTLESIEVEEGNEYFHSKNNCLIETATKTLVLGCKNSIIPVMALLKLSASLLLTVVWVQRALKSLKV